MARALINVPPKAKRGEIIEIKTLIEAQGKAWEEHKKTNDQLLAAKADGKAVADIEAKLAKINGDIEDRKSVV